MIVLFCMVFFHHRQSFAKLTTVTIVIVTSYSTEKWLTVKMIAQKGTNSLFIKKIRPMYICIQFFTFKFGSILLTVSVSKSNSQFLYAVLIWKRQRDFYSRNLFFASARSTCYAKRLKRKSSYGINSTCLLHILSETT